MSAINGSAEDPVTSPIDAPSQPASAVGMFRSPWCAQFSTDKINKLVAELEVPFDLSRVEWRIINTNRANKGLRGLVIPYADQRAYTDRLNALFTPAGWTRKYAIHTSASFQGGKDEKTVAKVFVACDLTIFGIGCHSATGEEWAEEDHAVTRAEAQAFKRACCCFGLGRYLYRFTGIWVDLDDNKRLKSRPLLTGWATPEGWRKGLRPLEELGQPRFKSGGSSKSSEAIQDGPKHRQKYKHDELIREIEEMAERLGRGLYRGILKTAARVWKPSQIEDRALLEKVFAEMQSADRALRRLEAIVEQAGSESLKTILRSLHFNSLDQLNDVNTLRKIVDALEANAEA